MTTFYDEIVAGIVTLFKFCMYRDIYEKHWFSVHLWFFKVLPGQQFLKDLLHSKNILLRTAWSFIPGWKKINNYIYISIYSLTTLNKPKSRQVYTNDGIITQNILNAAVSTSVELKTNTKKLYFCEYLLSTWCLLHPEYQI